MSVQSIPDFRNARIIDAARQGSTISGIARQTGIPFPTVRRAVYAFENIGVIKTTKMGKKVFVRVASSNHPVVNSMVESARWVSSIIWDPDAFVARMFERHGINYAFVGTSKIKYTRDESRNMVQVVVARKHYDRAKEIIAGGFGGIGIDTTDDPRKTIGNANSVIYVKCFPVDKVGYKERMVRTANSEGRIAIRIADGATEQSVMRQGSREDMMFIPSANAA